MGKAHRDNHKARLKRGSEAFALKAERRSDHGKGKCNLCGREVQKEGLVAGLCPACLAGRVDCHADLATSRAD
jgi:Zn finger protein HypA/HybF involved in hydrogenase expression